MRSRLPTGALAALSLPVALTGCLLAAAGAGAGGAIYASERGQESVVAATVDRTFDAAQQTFREMGITETGRSSDQDGSTTRRELRGSLPERSIHVTLERQGASTKVEVVASKTEVTWDKDLAKRILERIVTLSR